MKRHIAIILFLFLAVGMNAQDTLLTYRLNLVKHPITKKYGYAFKAQNINSPIRGATSTAINMIGSAGSQLISKEKAENIDWAIPPQYEAAARKFSENLAMVKVNGKVGFIDLYNRFVIEPVYDDVEEMDGFHEGLAAVRKNGKWGYINKLGKTVIPFEYDEADAFDEDMVAAVRVGEQWGAIDVLGNMVVDPDKKIKTAMITVPGSNKVYRAAVAEAREKKNNGTFDTRLAELQQAGREVNRHINASTRQSLTYTLVGSGDHQGVVDHYGREIVPQNFSGILFDKDDGIYIVERDGKYGAYLYNGSRLIAPCFDTMSQFSAGKAKVTVCGISGWIDVNGNLDPKLLYNMSIAGINIKKTDRAQALAIYERILEINPEYAQAYNNIALIDIEKEDYNKGMKKLKLAHELDPNDSIIAGNLAWAKACRKERRQERWSTGLSVATAILGIAATTYSTYSAIKDGGDAPAMDTASDGFGGSAGGASRGPSGSSSGSVRCKNCQGTGDCSSTSGTANRYYCHGSGRCGYCSGGIVYAAGTQTVCTACHGTNKCKYCHGSGKCKTCQGSGKQ